MQEMVQRLQAIRGQEQFRSLQGRDSKKLIANEPEPGDGTYFHLTQRTIGLRV